MITAEQKGIVTEMVGKYQQYIFDATGVHVRLNIEYVVNRQMSIPALMEIVARALDMKKEDYGQKCRHTRYLNLRMMGCLMLRRYYPQLSLTRIAQLMGGWDHTTIKAIFKNIDNYTETKDARFLGILEIVETEVKQWLAE